MRRAQDGVVPAGVYARSRNRESRYFSQYDSKVSVLLWLFTGSGGATKIIPLQYVLIAHRHAMGNMQVPVCAREQISASPTDGLGFFCVPFRSGWNTTGVLRRRSLLMSRDGPAMAAGCISDVSRVTCGPWDAVRVPADRADSNIA